MALPVEKISLADFIEWENAQPERHEFYCGEVFAMVGVKRIHGTISLNIATSLKQQLHGSPCQVFTEALKVQVDADSIFYPDVFVTCDTADLSTDYIFRAPSVVVEVLSDSTQAYDRGLKFTLYRRLAALREYVLIDPELRLIEVYRRGDNGLFTLYDYTAEARFPLTSIGCELVTADVFEGV